MRKFIFKTFIFVTIGLCVLSFLDRRLPFYWGNEGLVSKMNKLEADHFDYDTYFVGSSRVYRHIIPSLFDSLNQGATHSFNLGYLATRPPEMYYFLDRFIDKCNEKTKYIFVELGMMQNLTEVNRGTLRSTYYLDYEQYTTAASACVSNKRYETAWNYTLSYLSRIMRMGMIIKSLTFDKKSGQSKALGKHGDGYYGLEEEMKDVGNTDSTFIKRLAYFYKDTTTLTKRYEKTLKEHKKNASALIAAPANLRQLHQIIEKAARKGIKIIIIRSPRNPGLTPLYNALETENKLDMSNPVKYSEFYLAKYSFDVGHFNQAGSQLFTHALADEFQRLVHR